jgi:hypothetical protein
MKFNDLSKKLEEIRMFLNFDQRNYLIDILQSSRYRAYEEGYKAGLEIFAHWKDGEQLVGTTGTTLKQALEDTRKFYNYSPDTVDLLKEKNET